MISVRAVLSFLCCLILATSHAQGSQSSIKNINNGITFTITGCTGDSSSGRVTVYFKLSNPSKPNQKITIGEPIRREHEVVAMDENSTVFRCGKIMLGGTVVEGNPYNMSNEAELPSGLSLTGSATFTNISPSLHTLALVNIFEKSCNWDGGTDLNGGVVEVRNIPINWSKFAAGK